MAFGFTTCRKNVDNKGYLLQININFSFKNPMYLTNRKTIYWLTLSLLLISLFLIWPKSSVVSLDHTPVGGGRTTAPNGASLDDPSQDHGNGLGRSRKKGKAIGEVVSIGDERVKKVIKILKKSEKARTHSLSETQMGDYVKYYCRVNPVSPEEKKRLLAEARSISGLLTINWKGEGRSWSDVLIESYALHDSTSELMTSLKYSARNNIIFYKSQTTMNDPTGWRSVGPPDGPTLVNLDEVFKNNETWRYDYILAFDEVHTNDE